MNQQSLIEDLERLGVKSGDTLMVHASMRPGTTIMVAAHRSLASSIQAAKFCASERTGTPPLYCTTAEFLDAGDLRRHAVLWMEMNLAPGPIS